MAWGSGHAQPDRWQERLHSSFLRVGARPFMVWAWCGGRKRGLADSKLVDGARRR